MPGRADRLVGDDRSNGARRHDRQPQRPAAEAHDQPEEIDRQQEVEPERMRVGKKPPEIAAKSGLRHPGHPDRRAEAEIPGKGQPAARFAPALRLGELRIAEQEEGERPLQQRPPGDRAAERCRIKHVAEIDGEDRQHDQPGRYLVAEQLDADHLAGAAIDGGAHQHRLEHGKSVVDGERAKQQAERQHRDDHRHAGPHAQHELARSGFAIDGFGCHRTSRKTRL